MHNVILFDFMGTFFKKKLQAQITIKMCQFFHFQSPTYILTLWCGVYISNILKHFSVHTVSFSSFYKQYLDCTCVRFLDTIFGLCKSEYVLVFIYAIFGLSDKVRRKFTQSTSTVWTRADFAGSVKVNSSVPPIFVHRYFKNCQWILFF